MKTSTKIEIIVFSLFALVFIGCIAGVIDSELYDCRYYNEAIYKSNCDYKVPPQWKIVTNGELYAIKKTDFFEDEYLYYGRSGLTTMFSSISRPTLFLSECKAKDALESYIKDQQPKITGFK